jgi:hypothetical protein
MMHSEGEIEQVPSVRTLEEMIGKVVRRVESWSDGLTIHFENGLSVEIEADEDELRYYISDREEKV